MKHNKTLRSVFLVVILLLSTFLAACATTEVEVPVTGYEASDYEASDVELDELEEHDVALSEIELTIATLSALTISDESRINFQESVFAGGGPIVATGGMGLIWYFHVFGDGVVNIQCYIIDLVGNDRFRTWTQQFVMPGSAGSGGNRRIADLRALIEDFDLSAGDVIRAQESAFGISMAEIDELVNWGRYGVHSTAYEVADAMFWAIHYSISDIEALFSGDIHQMWDAFPGYGVAQNGRAYSPEWILYNIERAVTEEQIPLGEIWRIINMAEYFPELDEVVANAKAFLESGGMALPG